MELTLLPPSPLALLHAELLLSALVGFLFFAEIPAVATLVGAAVIIPSTLFVVWQESQGGKSDSAPEPPAPEPAAA